LLLFLCVSICPATTIFPTTTVIGSDAEYEIYQANVTIVGTSVTVALYFDTGAVGTSNPPQLGAFTDPDIQGLSMVVGDLFFYNPNTVYDPSDTSNDPTGPNALLYAVPLDTAGRSFTPGAVYQLGPGDTETAETALNNPYGISYYYDVTVLMTSAANGGNPVAGGIETVVNDTAPGADPTEYVVTESFTATTAFMTSLEFDDQIGIMFSSADCGNDYIEGTATVSPAPTPEPAALSLVGLALLGLGILCRRRAWRADWECRPAWARGAGGERATRGRHDRAAGHRQSLR
jgi:hypothetical protein